jgi:hypothetical protein
MRMQHPPQVLGRDERRDRAGLRALDLVEAFAQLGFDVLEIERLVDVGLGFRCDDLAATAQPFWGEGHVHRNGAALQVPKVPR